MFFQILLFNFFKYPLIVFDDRTKPEKLSLSYISYNIIVG